MAGPGRLWPRWARLISWGCVLLAIAVTVERFLRTARAGITSRQLSQAEGLPAMMNIAGSAVITPVAAATPASLPYQGAGGGSAGGGRADATDVPRNPVDGR